MPLTLIDSARHIVLIVHKNPDADSLGSACAFYSYLLRSQKKITLFCVSDNINQNLAFLPWFDKLSNRFPEDADCMVSFDCGSYERLGINKSLPLINIDHHISNDDFGTYNIVDTSAISTTEVVYDFFVANSIKINGKMALSLYAGLMDDSKCFSAPKCSAKTFSMAHDLIELGAEHALCIEWLYHRRSLASLRIRGALMKQMKLLADGQLALFEVPLSLLEETGADVAECKRVVEDALGIRSVRAAMIQIEHPRGGLKLSLRTDGTIDASKIMGHFGGGGHVHRAGTHLEQGNFVELVESMTMMIKKGFE
ncbi:MAG: DHH family phosphoesterase [Sulfuricurvum sp.]|uniref:DHH family phosphoesterase n=1 Tax=Sulfuricurvum sp. TaxID=2025608 RepID=UPI0026284689|nr:DHH family phosphoesterase [Sulfuricurvum sp.]MDD2369473.1 DHH family phosphoesterase [Sulfuricurvum sp.]MDD2950346.1 DHH family phosphoesterase [Sulfuricurvum sp.]MDD5118284.1 DHH family phosphoesterase [Sulfuricurvum sp.]